MVEIKGILGYISFRPFMMPKVSRGMETIDILWIEEGMHFIARGAILPG